MNLCTVTGKLVNPDGSANAGASVSFALQYPSGDVPRQPGGDDIWPLAVPSVTTGSDGSFSTQIIGNDQITPSGTKYLVTFKVGSNAVAATYTITGSTFDLTSATPSTATGASSPVSLPSSTINVTAPNAGNFSVTHYLGRVPAGALIMMTSAGSIWFQVGLKWDGANLYLVASAAELTAEVMVW